MLYLEKLPHPVLHRLRAGWNGMVNRRLSQAIVVGSENTISGG
jgi:hypothetical protein